MGIPTRVAGGPLIVHWTDEAYDIGIKSGDTRRRISRPFRSREYRIKIPFVFLVAINATKVH